MGLTYEATQFTNYLFAQVVLFVFVQAKFPISTPACLKGMRFVPTVLWISQHRQLTVIVSPSTRCKPTGFLEGIGVSLKELL